MNLENKKQVATILLAIGIGLVAVLFTSKYVQDSINKETKRLAADYEQKNRAQKEALLKEMAAMQQDYNQKITALEQKQKALIMTAGRGPGEAKGVVPMTSFSIKTPPGKRAFTIKISSLDAVGGLINAGDFVDIIAHLDIPNELDLKVKPEHVTSVLFQNVQVLAVETNFEPLANPPQYVNQQKAKELTITLALSAEEAGLLAFAQKNGSFQLSLRGPTETEVKIVQVASWNSLSDFVLEKQGTELVVPHQKAIVPKTSEGKVQEADEVAPVIQIFKSGYESKL